MPSNGTLQFALVRDNGKVEGVGKQGSLSV